MEILVTVYCTWANLVRILIAQMTRGPKFMEQTKTAGIALERNVERAILCNKFPMAKFYKTTLFGQNSATWRFTILSQGPLACVVVVPAVVVIVPNKVRQSYISRTV